MKIKQIATATLMPAAIAGLALATGPTADAATHRSLYRIAAHALGARGGEPGSAPDWVTVRPGQTLTGIAAAHHMPWEAIYATPPNTRRLGNPDLLTVGERLRIPSDPRLRAAQFRAKDEALLAGRAPAAPAATSAGDPAAGAGSNTAGMSSFGQCVAWRESSDTPTDPDGLFGILPATWASLGYSGTAGEASVAVQEQAFSRLYARDGTAPWAPYDGC